MQSFAASLSIIALVLSFEGLGTVGPLTPEQAIFLMKGYYSSEIVYIVAIGFAKSSAATKLRLGESAHRKLGRAFAIVRITTSFASAIVHPFQKGTQPTNKDLQPQTNFLKLMLLQSHPNAGFDYAICGTLLAIPGSKLLLRLTAATVQPISGATNSSNAIASDIHGRKVSWSASPEESLWSRGADNTVVQPCAASEVQYHNASSDATADDYI
ncbi:uncharacterized protein J4E78_006791 [Alternaria triticimaculans]|uniref:uncharacterized protein n=1 Tax=Alternaria triticimaculans TaxID=297637 RepID=UPI0020C4A5ED|nr:uncharacterized protein J4E78_006791 [Alternaria triticimaculans]KAI4656900.1 hypothetical protein J4E78_006791 [Alternaria triticimaculans]